MGKTHAMSGMCVGLALAPLFGLHTLPDAGLFALTVAGFALMPDLDHDTSSASRLLGPLTGRLCAGVQWVSRLAWERTRTGKDRGNGEHRALTHTALFAVALGLLVWGLSLAWPAPTTIVVLVVGLVLAADRLGDWVIPAGIVAAVASAAALPQPEQLLAASASWAGAAVAIGCLTHTLGDACTLSGVPLLWPLQVNDQRWFDVGIPRFARFSTGGPAETWWMGAFAVGCVLGGTGLIGGGVGG